ncbi:hypothetical protein [Williamwhitmania taraxaci]|uniref:Outer membrane protein beta-barrel domain-containing protein n=1 Tax=Williamwhitmania taraxaci TaxID=1640674 RepID=A0A1G6GI51_9BACT|nr:hypothetical protein [Williamwhitmania taraxaci]SDB81677.1 hypothetical protein SAMN05216323_1001103 [Williamwhitmania taraxaci]
MKRIAIRILFVLLASVTVEVGQTYAQGQVDTSSSKIFYRNEMTGGIMLNSNGFGFGYRFAKRQNYLNKRIFEADFSWVKHPKEERINNPAYPSNRSFVFGKQNNFYTLRLGAGLQRELFSKADVGSIAIRVIGSTGFSLGILKPCYYEVLTTTAIPNEYETHTQKFTENIHSAFDIYQRSSFFKGINEVEPVPGAYIKAALSFEYSHQEEILHVIEGGMLIEGFYKKIPIMALTENNQFFISVFISYRFGRVIDPRLQAIRRQQRKDAVE